MGSNCFAYEKNGRCTVLDFEKCMGRGCYFKKTKEEFQVGRVRNYENLRKLSFDRQVEIAKKYYAGKMPWSKEGGL